jgi:hypothetical protein
MGPWGTATVSVTHSLSHPALEDATVSTHTPGMVAPYTGLFRAYLKSSLGGCALVPTFPSQVCDSAFLFPSGPEIPACLEHRHWLWLFTFCYSFRATDRAQPSIPMHQFEGQVVVKGRKRRFN